MEIHLDLVGGLAGDMFIAAMLDAFPALEADVLDGIASLDGSAPTPCTVHVHTDGILMGRRFEVIEPAQPSARPPYAHRPTDPAQHEHRTWNLIRARLTESTLDPAVREIAVGIFQLLADAEAAVHGVAPEAVSFHEVGAWDSVADIVGAAVLIHAVGASRWTASPAPLGGGRVATQHGMLAVPAPATAHLLSGMPTLDDGIGGERVTPTGAAILRYLCPPTEARAGTVGVPRTLMGSGTGFGRRVLPGLSNHVRVLWFSPAADDVFEQRRMHVLEFEVDDQSSEELAAGLDRLRTLEPVLDVTQSSVVGKKGRIMTHVRVLVRDALLQTVVDACFRETTTIGLRHRLVGAVGLKRRIHEVEVDGNRFRVKVVERPGGATAKTEADDVVSHRGHARRASLRRQAEAIALAEYSDIVDV